MKEKIAIPIHKNLQYGLGDVFRTIYRHKGWFSRLKAASKDYDITIFICSHNQYTCQVFAHMDYITVINTPWTGKHPHYTELARRNDCSLVRPKFFNNYASEPVEVELNKREQNKYDAITKKPVLIIHPFAGDASRMPIKSNQYHKLVRFLRARTDSNIVILGGTYTRNKRLKTIPRKKMHEVFPNIDVPGVYNLVGKISTRLSAKLTETAEYFIGNWSAYACIAWERQVPMIMFSGPNGHKEFMRRRSNMYKWNTECHSINAKGKNHIMCFTNAANSYANWKKQN